MQGRDADDETDRKDLLGLVKSYSIKQLATSRRMCARNLGFHATYVEGPRGGGGPWCPRTNDRGIKTARTFCVTQ